MKQEPKWGYYIQLDGRQTIETNNSPPFLIPSLHFKNWNGIFES